MKKNWVKLNILSLFTLLSGILFFGLRKYSINIEVTSFISGIFVGVGLLLFMLSNIKLDEYNEA